MLDLGLSRLCKVGVAKALIAGIAFRGRVPGAAGEPPPLLIGRTVPPACDLRQLAAQHALCPDARAALDEIGLPADFSQVYDGPLRAADAPKEAARRFVVWMRATGQAGAYTADRLLRRYAEFGDVDHRHLVAENFFLGVLKRTQGVRKERPREGTRRLRWTIEPGRLGRAAQRPPVMHTTKPKPSFAPTPNATPGAVSRVVPEARMASGTPAASKQPFTRKQRREARDMKHLAA